MSRVPPDRAASPTTPHELVRELETSIEARLAAADQARAEVAQAQATAEHLLAEAAERAERDAQHRAAVILADARAEAVRLTEAGNRSAAELTAVAARRRDEDVAAVVSWVLPARPGPASRAVSSP